MPLGTFIAGRYLATWDAVSVGITTDGFDLQTNLKAETINRSDAYGDSLIDFVYRGGDVMVSFEAKEYMAGTIAPFWPWAGGGVPGRMFNTANPIGVLGSDNAKSLVMTAVAATPAAVAGSPTSLTALWSIRPPGDQSLRFNSTLRTVPIRLQCLPLEGTGTGSWFTTT